MGDDIFITGHDVRTQNTRALLLDERGRVVARAAKTDGMTSPPAGWAEQEPRDRDRALGAVIREVTATVAVHRWDEDAHGRRWAGRDALEPTFGAV